MMAYEKILTRNQRIALEGNIPGSLGWILKKNDGVFPEKTVTRNNMKFEKPKSVNNGPDYHEQAINNGWTYHLDTQTWTHPSYNMRPFPSIYQTLDPNSLWETKKAVPYHNNDDELGLAYNYTIGCSGQIMNIFPNKWYSEEFDTRHGRRRELWRHKKEMRKKYSLQFQAYKEQKQEAERNGEEDYNREFTINE